jgi:hypothetical protein
MGGQKRTWVLLQDVVARVLADAIAQRQRSESLRADSHIELPAEIRDGRRSSPSGRSGHAEIERSPTCSLGSLGGEVGVRVASPPLFRSATELEGCLSVEGERAGPFSGPAKSPTHGRWCAASTRADARLLAEEVELHGPVSGGKALGNSASPVALPSSTVTTCADWPVTMMPWSRSGTSSAPSPARTVSPSCGTLARSCGGALE